MNLIARARAIVIMPREAWPRIAAEPDSGQRLFSGYVVPLAAIGPVCSLLSLAVFQHRSLLGIVTALVSFASSLVFVWAESLIVARVAPRFGSTLDPVQSLKLIAYSSTPGWLAGVFFLVPLLGFVALVAQLYGLYLMRLGIGPVLGVSQDRQTDCFLIVLLTSIGVGIVLGILATAVIAPFALASMLHHGSGLGAFGR